jgi:hypothetical protein
MKRTIKITESQMRKIIDRISEGEYHMDEAMFNVAVDDLDKVADKLPADAEVTVTEELLDEDIFEEGEEIDASKGFDGVPSI